MKKNKLIALLALPTLFLGLTSIQETKAADFHDYCSWNELVRKGSDCISSGSTYYECSICGKCYSDQWGSNLISNVDEYIQNGLGYQTATGHEFTDGFYCNENYHFRKCKHNYCPVDEYEGHVDDGFYCLPHDTDGEFGCCSICGYRAKPAHGSYIGTSDVWWSIDGEGDTETLFIGGFGAIPDIADGYDASEYRLGTIPWTIPWEDNLDTIKRIYIGNGIDFWPDGIFYRISSFNQIRFLGEKGNADCNEKRFFDYGVGGADIVFSSCEEYTFFTMWFPKSTGRVSHNLTLGETKHGKILTNDPNNYGKYIELSDSVHEAKESITLKLAIDEGYCAPSPDVIKVTSLDGQISIDVRDNAYSPGNYSFTMPDFDVKVSLDCDPIEKIPNGASWDNASTCNFWWKTQDNNETLVVGGEGAISEYYISGGVGLESSRPWESVADKVKNIYVVGNISKIGSDAFRKFANLEMVSLSNNIQKIDDGAFAENPKLKDVYFYGTPTAIAETSFNFGTRSADDKINLHNRSKGNLNLASNGLLGGGYFELANDVDTTKTITVASAANSSVECRVSGNAKLVNPKGVDGNGNVTYELNAFDTYYIQYLPNKNHKVNRSQDDVIYFGPLAEQEGSVSFSAPEIKQEVYHTVTVKPGEGVFGDQVPAGWKKTQSGYSKSYEEDTKISDIFAVWEEYKPTNGDYQFETWKVSGTNLTYVTENIVLTAKFHHHGYPTLVKGIPATCTTPGAMDLYRCSCGDYYYDYECQNYFGSESDYNWYVNQINTPYINPLRVPALGHSFDGEATCSWDGNECTIVVKCSHAGCNETQTVNRTGSYVKDTAASCEHNEMGHYEVNYNEYNFSTGKNSVEVPNTKLEHSYGSVHYTWNGNMCTATHECSSCGKIESETVVATYVIDRHADCRKDEVGHYEATFLNPAFGVAKTERASVVIEDSALGHSYEAPTFVWEGNKCTASITCERCGVTTTEVAYGTYVRDAAATCESNELGHYEVVFKNPLFGRQSSGTGSVEIEGTIRGHNYMYPTYTWDGDKCTATISCIHYGCEETITETVTATYVTDSEANYKQNEFGHYEASFTSELFTTQSTAANSVELENTMLKLSAGAIVGIVLGGLVVLGIIALVIILLSKKRRK